jgi:hypothetical protein
MKIFRMGRIDGRRAATRIPSRIRLKAATLSVLIGMAAGVVLGAGCPAKNEPLPEGECGDGVLNRGEECDLGVDNSDILPDTCRTDCLKPYCGDHVIDTGEVCDSSDLGGRTCLDMGFLEGQLKCSDTCELDTAECSTCGDGVVSGDERCDGADLAGATCAQVGFDGGQLGCTENCTFDVTACVGGCGNGTAEAGEACDGADLDGESCADRGFSGGTLACGEACEFDFTGCTGGCGNGVVEDGEACDDANDEDYDGCSGCRCGDGTFGAPVLLSTCRWPLGASLADMNGDGAADVLVGCGGGAQGRGGVAVHLNDGDATFGASDFFQIGVPITALTTADLDGDGAQDVIVTFLPSPLDDGQTGGGVAVLAGRGDGTLDASEPMVVGARPIDVVAAELNGDGFIDVAAADLVEQRIHVLTGNGDTTLTRATFLYNYGGPSVVEAADINLDGTNDLISLRQNYDLTVVYVGSGDGTFSSPISRIVGDRPTGVAVGSFNDDTFPDLAVVNSTEGTVSVLVGFGDGQFAYPGEVVVEQGLGDVKTAYVDCDSISDLIVAATSTDRVWVLVGDGGGGFSVLGEGFATCDSPVELELGDVNGDLLWDVVVPCSFADTVAVHLGNAAAE